MNTLPIVRYLTAGDAYHFEVDNRPLQDLAARDVALASGVSALEDSARLGSLADSFIARGLAKQNTMVGKLQFNNTMGFTVTRSFMTQEVEVDPTGQPGKILPALAISATPASFTFTKPSSGNIRPFSVQARRVAPSVGTPPFYKSTQSAFTDVYNIEYAVVAGTDVPSNPTYPAIPAGWIELFRLATTSNSSSIPAGLVTKVQFKDEGEFGGASSGPAGQYEYIHEQIVVADTPTSTLTGIGVNCMYAFVFVDGAIQYSVSRDTPSTLTFSEPLPVGTVVDVIVTAGGLVTPGSPTQTYQKFVATAGQTVFPGILAKNDTALVFLTGVLQDRLTWEIDDVTKELTFSDPCVLGEEVIVMELRALAGGGGGGGGGGAYSEALAGGVQDQVLTKNSGSDGDFSWKDSPVRGVPVSAIMTFPTMGVPLGFLKCNGEVKLRTTYPALFDKIGTTYNTGGELLTEFRLPDLRAEFIRGWDDGRGVDVGRIFASSQADMLRSHNHSTFNFYSSIVGSKNISLSPSFASGTTITGTAGGAETRPRNVAMTFAIKAFDSIDAGVVLDLETYVDEKIATAGGGGSSAPGTVVQVYTALNSLSYPIFANTPVDDTPPQKTEGEEFLAITFTPKYINSRINITAEVPYTISVQGSASGTIHMHRDSAANAFAATQVTSYGSDGKGTTSGVTVLTAEFASGSLAPMVIHLRAGKQSANVLQFIINKNPYGMTSRTRVRVEELRG